MPFPGLLHPEPLSLQLSTAELYLHRRYSETVLSQSLWGLWVLVHTRVVWALWVSLVGIGLDSKCNFAPPTVFLGLLLCPWIWGISSKSLLHHTAAAAIDYVLCSQRWRSSIQSAKTRPGADCGSDHELLIAKFKLKLKKVGNISNPIQLYSGSDK